MKGLKELHLVNMPGVRDSMDLIENTVVHHKSLEILNLAKNNIENYDAIVSILRTNRCIQKINVRGSLMTADHIGYIWLGLRENINILEIEHQYEKLAFSPDYLIAVDIEMVLN